MINIYLKTIGKELAPIMRMHYKNL